MGVRRSHRRERHLIGIIGFPIRRTRDSSSRPAPDRMNRGPSGGMVSTPSGPAAAIAGRRPGLVRSGRGESRREVRPNRVCRARPEGAADPHKEVASRRRPAAQRSFGTSTGRGRGRGGRSHEDSTGTEGPGPQVADDGGSGRADPLGGRTEAEAAGPVFRPGSWISRTLHKLGGTRPRPLLRSSLPRSPPRASSTAGIPMPPPPASGVDPFQTLSESGPTPAPFRPISSAREIGDRESGSRDGVR